VAQSVLATACGGTTHLGNVKTKRSDQCPITLTIASKPR
jgi:hypothetical protein